MSISAADLKAQGNALFGQKNFAEAEKKYTAAIEASADPKGLAVLYANRAACRLSLKRYMDASSDATKATQLDPAYPKAFARLATAQDHLGKYTASTENWKQALDVLPANLTTAEQVQKVQYEAGLKTATAALAKLQNTVIGDRPGPMGSGGPFIVKGEGRMPWDIAAQTVPRLRVQQPVDLYSSAWVIHGAYDDFMNGVRLMGQIQKDNRTGAMSGTRGGLVELSNGVLRDIRVMHLPSGDFIAKYNTLVSFDIQTSRGWGDHGPDQVIREALSRQRSEGWDATRPAVSFTVRAWIMQGIMNTSMRHMPEVAAEFYKNSLHVIRTLKEHWINESKKDRGTIFEKTFIFGIRQLYLEAIMQCYKGEDSSDEPLEQLLEESESLIHDVDAALRQPRPQDPVDPGFVSSFYIYPRGHAFAMKGFYYNKMSTRNGNDRKAFFRKAALEYIEAAKCFPEDDEKHPWFLHVAYTNMMTAGSFSLRETLDIMERIRVTIPKAKVIWERSSLGAGGMWDIVAGVQGQEQQLRSMLAQGQFTLDSCIATKVVEHP
ncbi:hypothetical protein DFH06DRAFT_505391 [Mycena polygramma]|nr:hypothetical protein DFH06DRAFT_505391 [Mycena polygramma]